MARGDLPNMAELVAAGEKLMVCIDGPRAGHCYWLSYGPSSWERQRELAATSDGPGDTFSGYETTGNWVKHPTLDGAQAEVWRWNPRGNQ